MAKKIKYSDMSVEKVRPSGAYVISHLSDGVLNSKQYQGYTKKQAMKLHKDNYEKGLTPRKVTAQNKRDAMDAELGESYADNALDKKINNRFSNERKK
jgi:hypothetical protein